MNYHKYLLTMLGGIFIPSLAFAAITFPNLDPNAFTIFGFSVKWYGLFYLFGLIAVYVINRIFLYYEHKNSIYNSKITNEEFLDIAVNGFLCAVAGGRLGYVLFYNLSYYLQHPIEILYVHQGGMSFHGGFLGAVAYIVFHFRNKTRFWNYADAFSSTIPVALGLGRIANFINGELWGRVTDVSWGMIFPSGGPLARHPSQLYQAALEGGLLLLITLFIRSRRINKPGLLTGVFIAGYGIARFVVEFFREPDAQIGYYLDTFTQGQLLSLPMVIIGGYLIMRKH